MSTVRRIVFRPVNDKMVKPSKKKTKKLLFVQQGLSDGLCTDSHTRVSLDG